MRGSFGSGWAASKYLQQAGSSKPNKPAPTPSKPAPSSSGSGSFSAGTLKKVFPLLPASKADLYFPYLNAAMNAANINTCKRRAAFLAQLGHESGQVCVTKWLLIQFLVALVRRICICKLFW